jgi:hypothetical protein
MEKEASCNFEDIYSNPSRETSEQHTTHLLHDTLDKKSIISIYCTYIYNYIVSWFFPSYINSIYE